MFNLFGRKTAKDFMEEANETYNVPPMPEVVKPKKDPCLYTVGTTLSGGVVLRLQADDGYGNMTLTMNAPATRQLIRMLEAALTQESENVETDPVSD